MAISNPGSNYLPQQTIRYKTYIKETLVEGLEAVFKSHRDEVLRRTKVGIDFPITQTSYPAVQVRFFERSINNAGVGHVEWLEDGDTGKVYQFKHYLFQGDIEFAIFAQSSLDRDLIGDSLVQILSMGQLEPYTDLFFERIYNPDTELKPAALETYMTLNTDQIRPFGETQALAPWMPEDELIYQTSYRIEIHGEIYNRIFDGGEGMGYVEHVDVFPYRKPLDPEPVPQGNPDDPALWS